MLNISVTALIEVISQEGAWQAEEEGEHQWRGCFKSLVGVGAFRDISLWE